MHLLMISKNQCGECEKLKKALRHEEVEFEEINISNDPDAIDKYDVMGAPTTLLMDGEEEWMRVVGNFPDEVMDLAEQI